MGTHNGRAAESSCNPGACRWRIQCRSQSNEARSTGLVGWDHMLSSYRSRHGVVSLNYTCRLARRGEANISFVLKILGGLCCSYWEYERHGNYQGYETHLEKSDSWCITAIGIDRSANRDNGAREIVSLTVSSEHSNSLTMQQPLVQKKSSIDAGVSSLVYMHLPLERGSCRHRSLLQLLARKRIRDPRVSQAI